MAEKMQGPSPDYYLPKSDGAVSCLYYFHPELDAADKFQSKRGILLSGTQKGSLYTWDLRTRRPTSVISAHSNAILSLTVTNDDELISQGRDGLIHRWKADAKDTWTKLGTFVCCSPELRHFYTDLNAFVKPCCCGMIIVIKYRISAVTVLLVNKNTHQLTTLPLIDATYHRTLTKPSK